VWYEGKGNRIRGRRKRFRYRLLGMEEMDLECGKKEWRKKYIHCV